MSFQAFSRLLPPDETALHHVLEDLSDIAVVLTPEGEVLGAFARDSHPASTEVGAWVDSDFRETLTGESRPKLDRALKRLAENATQTITIEVNHATGEVFGIPVSYTLHALDNGRRILLAGRDRQEVASTQQRLMGALIATERAAQKQRHHETTLTAVLESVDAPLMILNRDSGMVEDANAAAHRLLGHDPDDPSFSLSDAADLRDNRLVLSRDGRSITVARLDFRRGADQVSVLLLAEGGGRGGTGTDGTFAQAAFAAAVTDRDGRVLSLNAAFLTLTRAAASSGGRGLAMSELLGSGRADERAVLSAITRHGFIADFGTTLTSARGPVAVTLNAFALGGDDGARIAWLFQPRPGAERRESGDVSLMLAQMVGHMSLSDILSQATIEIERMCIEEALRRTRNNRAAAATLLGLSRQSLYVRLRKFGLEAKAKR